MDWYPIIPCAHSFLDRLVTLKRSSGYIKRRDGIIPSYHFTILRAYELVPKAYRQNFQKLGRSASQTHVQFAREKSFEKLCTASSVSDFNQLKGLILLEEFKNCVPDCVVVYLKKQKSLLSLKLQPLPTNLF